MRRTVRFTIVAATLLAMVLSATVSAASAQGVSQVRAGSEVEVANSGECRPDADVALYFEGAGVDEVQVGSAVSDAEGSFATTVTIPAEAAEGAAAILVDCGLDGAVLTYDLEVIGSGFSLGSLLAPVLVGLGVIAIVGVLSLLRRRRDRGGGDEIGPDGDGGDGDLAEPAPAGHPIADVAMPDPSGTGAEVAGPASPDPVSPGAAPVPVSERPADHDDRDEGGIDDGADYWFWEAATSAGPRRRVACMTETTFHLHEVSVEAFQPMLDDLVAVGPDTALAQAFVRIPVAALDRVVREGTVVHFEGRGANGPRRQTVDLAEGADGVVEMLARRLPVVDAGRMQESVH